MPTAAFTATLEHLSARLADQRVTLAAAWLDHLQQMLPVDAREVFPTPTLLDHIPDLIAHMATRLHGGDHLDAEADGSLMDKAEQLGVLRFDQRASVGQPLREYEALSRILDDFFLREVAGLGERGDAAAAMLAASRAQQAVRALQQRTVDVLVASYARRIDRKTSQLRTFSQLVSHEIRQPLGVLQVVARMLRRAGEPGDGSPMTETLERNVVRLGEVADQLERLALLSRPRQAELETMPVELSEVVAAVVSGLRDVAEANGVRIEVAPVLPTLPPGSDRGRLELALTNLVGNAVKYSDRGKPDRVVRVCADTEAPHPRLRVEDNGIGIAPAKLTRIFDHFVRAHAHLDDELGARGMGLGLAIVRDCADAMGAEVSVESAEGVGSVFTLEWPATRPISAS